MDQITLPRLHCMRCTDEEGNPSSWVPRTDHLPKSCPKCKSPYWNKPRKTEEST
jgi:hypothetical protein